MAQIIPLYRNWLVAMKDSDSKVAFSAMYGQFWKDLFLHAFRRVKDEQSAEDLVQDIFIQFWEQRRSLDVDMNLPAYLYGMLKFKVIDFFNSDKIKPTLLDHWADDIQHYAQENPVHLEAYLNLERLLEEELNKMPQNMKAAILLKWDQMNIKDIAAKLRLSEQTVKNNLTEGGKRLQRALTRVEPSKYNALIWVALQSIEMLTR